MREFKDRIESPNHTEDTMGELVVVFTQILVFWVVVAGFAYMLRGPRGAGAVMRWPVATAFRLLRRALGGILVALGNWIRG
jgi:hypothetical protein